VMIRKDGKIKLMDFGIARVMEGANLTVTGSILGSPAFMSPEQVTGQIIDFSSDLFSLGSILYLMSTGVMAFKGHNPHEILKKVVEGDFTPAQYIAPSMSDDFSAIIDRLLSVERDQRYSSAGDLLIDLDTIIKDAEIDRPGKEVNLLFENPEAYIEKFNVKLCELLERKALKVRDTVPALAMQYYNRLLAIEPDHAEANRQLERILNRKNTKERIKKISFVGFILALVTLLVWFVISLWQPSLPVEKVKPLVENEINASFPNDEKVETEKAETKEIKPPVAEIKKDEIKTSLTQPAIKSAKTNTKIVKKELKDQSKEDLAITGSLKVATVPWSDIYVNGKKVGNYPLNSNKEFVLQKGANSIKLVNPSCESFEKTITVTKAGQTEQIQQRLKMLPSFLKLDNSQGAMLFINGKFRGRTPIRENLEVRWVKHISQKTMLVSLTKEGYEPFNGKIRFAAGKVVPLKISLKKK